MKRRPIDRLWQLWGEASLYDLCMSEMNEGIARGDIDCMYFDVWRRFSNRPADEEYWREVYALAEKGQQEAMHAVECHEHPELLKIKPWPIDDRLPDCELLNNTISNEDFNAKVFSPLRMLERRRIEKGLPAPSYAEIVAQLMPLLPKELKVLTGMTKNAWSLNEDEKHDAQHSFYVMKLVGDGFMTLRIGNHTSNLGDYYKYRRMYVPSSHDFSNLCIMLHGDREQNDRQKYSFRFCARTADPCVTVRDEDFWRYRPFMYTIMHYIPGLIPDVQPLADAIIEWFSNNGEQPFIDPYRNIENGPSARMTAGVATIETWDIKYERRRREQAEKVLNNETH